MSRSYKSHPYVKDNKRGRKSAKRQANKKVRRFHKELSNGKSYRKVYNPWQIYDWYYYYPLSDAKRWDEKYDTDTSVKHWYQMCYWK